MCNKKLLLELKNPFTPTEIQWRVGSKSKDQKKATALPYINAREIMKRLDDILGLENWQDEYFTEPPRKVRMTQKAKWVNNQKQGEDEYYYEEISGRVICKLSIRINKEWITKSDGAGGTQIGGDKGAITDAFKRAAVKFGIARYIGYIDTQWVPIDQWGKFTSQPQLPQFALPMSPDHINSLIKK